MINGLAIGAVAFVAMEPLTAAAHRFVMHGRGWALHLSHHASRRAGLEANDAYPVAFAAVTMIVMAAGFQGVAGSVLVPATTGITVYGACYGFVHEIYIHQRIAFPWRVGVLEWMKDAHRLHHMWSGAPYGMLAPVVGRQVRERARALPGDYDPFARPVPTAA